MSPTLPVSLDNALSGVRSGGASIRPGTRRVTVKDVAQHAGVQHASVCVVLNGAKSNTHVSEAARERILAAAQELGYRRNGAMVTARTGRFNCAALLLSTEETRSNLPQPTWNGIHDELAAHNMALMMARLPDEKLTDEGVVPKILREWMADGLLIDYTNHIPQKMLELIRAHNLPAIWINSQQEGDCVLPDDREAGERLTNHLLQLGHRRVLYLDHTHDPSDPLKHYSHDARIAGYREAMEKAGLQARVEPTVLTPSEERETALRQLLQSEERPTAIVTYGDVELEILVAVAFDLGLRVPRDLSLACFALGARFLGQVVTTCFVPDYQVGREAAQLLREKINNPTRIFAPHVLKFGFESGQTCAPLG